jgi:hypothetical protein
MSIYKNDQAFSLWDYNISHQVLLLRCNGFNNMEYNNIDIVFMGVFLINIPTYLIGIEITELSIEQFDRYNLQVSEIHFNDKFFIVKSQEKEFVIGALAFSVFQNKLKFDVSSIRAEGASDHGIQIATS